MEIAWLSATIFILRAFVSKQYFVRYNIVGSLQTLEGLSHFPILNRYFMWLSHLIVGRHLN